MTFYDPDSDAPFCWLLQPQHLSKAAAADLKPSHSPVVLNPRPYLFLDEFLVESSSNVARRVNPPVHNPAIVNPIVTGREDQNFQPYLSVIREDKLGDFDSGICEYRNF